MRITLSSNGDMFRTDLIRLIQSLASDWLTISMLIVSAFGSVAIHEVVVSVVLLGVNLRKGFILAHTLFWASTLNDALKPLFGLPRPFEVDPEVQDLARVDTSSGGLSSMRAFSRLHRAAIDIFGSRGGVGYGFPSGHVSSTTAVWGGLSVLLVLGTVRIGERLGLYTRQEHPT
jgi:membrane-associated phospholipid phosphatase